MHYHRFRISVSRIRHCILAVGYQGNRVPSDIPRRHNTLKGCTLLLERWGWLIRRVGPAFMVQGKRAETSSCINQGRISILRVLCTQWPHECIIRVLMSARLWLLTYKSVQRWFTENGYWLEDRGSILATCRILLLVTVYRSVLASYQMGITASF